LAFLDSWLLLCTFRSISRRGQALADALGAAGDARRRCGGKTADGAAGQCRREGRSQGKGDAKDTR